MPLKIKVIVAGFIIIVLIIAVYYFIDSRRVVRYGPTSNEVNYKLEKFIKEAKFFENLAQDLRPIVNISSINIYECDEINAYYDPKTANVTVCYELIDDVLQTYSPGLPTITEKGYNQVVSDTLMFIILHEVGHALIDEYDLEYRRVVNNQFAEEDATDTLAIIILAESGLDRIVFNAANYFYIKSLNETIKENDTHSSHAKRFYNMICLIYGKYPNKYQEQISVINKDMANTCEYEYNRILRVWTEELAPFS